MATDAKQHAHELLDQLGPGQLAAVLHLLEVIIDNEDEELTEEDRHAIRSSREYFRKDPKGGVSFEQFVADCGFTIDQIREVD